MSEVIDITWIVVSIVVLAVPFVLLDHLDDVHKQVLESYTPFCVDQGYKKATSYLNLGDSKYIGCINTTSSGLVVGEESFRILEDD